MAGGIPLILSRVEGTIDEMLDVVDGVAIGGGRDIDPAATARSLTSSSVSSTRGAMRSSWSSSSDPSTVACRCSACAAGSR